MNHHELRRQLIQKRLDSLLSKWFQAHFKVPSVLPYNQNVHTVFELSLLDIFWTYKNCIKSRLQLNIREEIGAPNHIKNFI